MASLARSVRSRLTATTRPEPDVGALADLGHAAAAEQLAELVAPADQRLSVWVVLGSHW